MQLHLINGFLGSGKTTAIIAAARRLIGQGKTVGIVTNDKGQFQVDTAFFQSSRIPTRQVTGGCFRCSFEEFEERISELQKSDAPHAIFAESVGSCVDLVNTIFSPLQQNNNLNVEKTTYTVFADLRLFERWIQGEELPFSDAVNYLFTKQIEEGKLLILNKADLLAADRAEAILADAAARFPEKTIVLQNSLSPDGVQPWLDALESAATPGARPAFAVDYPTYKGGEQEMAWFDQELTFESGAPDRLKQALEALIGQVLAGLQEKAAFVGHVKFLLAGEGEAVKLSFTTADLLDPAFAPQRAASIPAISGRSLVVTLNARAALQASTFSEIVKNAVQRAAATPQIHIQTRQSSSYNPEMSLKRPAQGERNP